MFKQIESGNQDVQASLGFGEEEEGLMPELGKRGSQRRRLSR